MQSQCFRIFCLAAVFAAAAPAASDVLWSIGDKDGSPDEFGRGAARSVVYDAAKNSARNWRERQDAADNQPPVYSVRFELADLPVPAELVLDVFFLGPAPRTAEITVNGKRGTFRIRPVAARDIDERQSSISTFSRQTIVAPIDVSFLRTGANEIGIAFRGEGGSVHYDAVSLRRSGAIPALSATLEPTMFYRRSGAQLKEIAEVVVKHTRPVWKHVVKLQVGGATIAREDPGDGSDFGEDVIQVELPALAAPAPYELTMTTGPDTLRDRGVFRPERKWRLFAAFRIHNDIGYTDLQPHVEELDTRNTDGVLDLIARFPFYRFNLETTWLAENYIASRKPPRVAQLVNAALKGQVGINALYNNIMTGMCTGEEVYRALYPAKALARKYGTSLKFACLTDAPSHSWILPSVFADAGIQGFALASNQTRAPLLQNSDLNEQSPFYWEGPDGRRVLSWYTRSYLQFERLAGQKPSVEMLRRTIPQFLARYRRENYPADAVMVYGLYTDNAAIGDGGAELVKAWNETYEYPKLVPATDSDYYAYIEKNFAGKLPVIRGDGGAYWEDGAGSTAAEVALNRDSQRLLPFAEMAAALGAALDSAAAYPAASFREAWKNLIFFDEHTWGAHNSIAQPDRESVRQQWDFKRAYAWRAHWAAEDLLYRSLNRLVQSIGVDGPTLFVFNPDVSPRTDYVRVELEPSRELIDVALGAPVAVEEVGRGNGYRVLQFLAERVPGLGYKAYSVRPRASPAQPEIARRGGWEIESRYYRVALDPATGAVARIFDKELNRDLVDGAAPYKLNQLLYVSGGENSRILQDLTTLKPAKLEIAASSGAEMVENTGRRIVVRSRAPHVPEIRTEITVYDGVKRIDITNRLQKEEVRAKEAVYFAYPFRVSPPELLYQTQSAFVRPNTDQLPGACREWFTTQNLIVARDAGAAIAWATPDAPLVTLTDINRGLWLKQLDIRNGHVFSYAMNNYWFTNYKAGQGGEFTFRYAITSAGTLDDLALARFDAETRSPLVPYNYYDTGNVRIEAAKKRMPAAAASFLDVEAANAQLTAFKPAEDGNGYIVRLRETAGRKGAARLRSAVLPVTAAWRTNGVEDNLAPLPVKGGVIEIPLEPRRFTTVRLAAGAQPPAAARRAAPAHSPQHR